MAGNRYSRWIFAYQNEKILVTDTGIGLVLHKSISL
jgi:hypothetical protein